MQTILITGASSGIGKETAKLFQAKGWNVIATMRKPQEEKELVQLEHIKVLPCDVTDRDSIKAAVSEGIKSFGRIDAVVNNAGFYTLGTLEAATHAQIERQIDTNLSGLIAVTKEIIPHFRQQKSGTIINLSSIAGMISIPLQSLYHATKWGVEGFSESLRYELRPFHIHVRIIEPGVINTDFYHRSMTVTQDNTLTAYEPYSEKVIKNILKNGEKGSDPAEVAKTIYKAAVDQSSKLRYPTGYSKGMISLRKMLPLRFYTSIIRSAMER